jgi:hypothetical protein
MERTKSSKDPSLFIHSLSKTQTWWWILRISKTAPNSLLNDSCCVLLQKNYLSVCLFVCLFVCVCVCVFGREIEEIYLHVNTHTHDNVTSNLLNIRTVQSNHISSFFISLFVCHVWSVERESLQWSRLWVKVVIFWYQHFSYRKDKSRWFVTIHQHRHCESDASLENKEEIECRPLLRNS